MADSDFDLVVTVCNRAKESCPLFPKQVEVFHVGFEDPDGKEIGAFYETFGQIEATLLPLLRKKFGC